MTASISWLLLSAPEILVDGTDYSFASDLWSIGVLLYLLAFGKYPYEELDVTPLLFGFGYGGMEYPGLIMTNATSFYDGTLMDAWSLSDGLTHEIGHQWFYGTVGNNEYSEGWIDEGFTTYLERQLFGLYDGEAHKYLREIYDPSVVSLREIARFSKCIEFFKDYFKIKNESIVENNEMDNKLRSIICSIYLCYYIRLTSQDTRQAFENKLRPILLKLINIDEKDDVNDLFKQIDNERIKEEIIKMMISTQNLEK